MDLGEHEDGGLFHLALVILDQGVAELERLNDKAVWEYKKEILSRGQWERGETTDDDFLEARRKSNRAKTKLEEVGETFREATEQRRKTLRNRRGGSVEVREKEKVSVRKRKGSW